MFAPRLPQWRLTAGVFIACGAAFVIYGAMRRVMSQLTARSGEQRGGDRHRQ